MTYLEVVDILLVVLCVCVYAVMLYLKVKGDASETIVELIALMEESGFAGAEKMTNVVDFLYARIPVAFRMILTKPRLEELAQEIFGWMRAYANAYISAAENAESAEEREEMTSEAISAVNAEVIAELVSKLVSMSLAALKEAAEEKQIATDGLKTKDDFIRAIVKATLTNSM